MLSNQLNTLWRIGSTTSDYPSLQAIRKGICHCSAVRILGTVHSVYL